VGLTVRARARAREIKCKLHIRRDVYSRFLSLSLFLLCSPIAHDAPADCILSTNNRELPDALCFAACRSARAILALLKYLARFSVTGRPPATIRTRSARSPPRRVLITPADKGRTSDGLTHSSAFPAAPSLENHASVDSRTPGCSLISHLTRDGLLREPQHSLY